MSAAPTRADLIGMLRLLTEKWAALESADTEAHDMAADAVDALTEMGWIWDGDQWQKHTNRSQKLTDAGFTRRKTGKTAGGLMAEEEQAP